MIWWGLASIVGPLKRAPLVRPGAGTVASPAQPRATLRPVAAAPVRAAPSKEGAAILQHDFYTPSALGVIVPPAALAARTGAGVLSAWARLPHRLPPRCRASRAR